jgi:hypothetical protein
MTDASDRVVLISHGNNLADLFPGYYPPTKEERQDAYRRGLVSIDANALLDLYRFSERARNEFFDVLKELRPRLFITHQATLEFYRNRLSVVAGRLGATEDKCKEIVQAMRGVIQRIQEFANRYQINMEERQRLTGLIEELSSTLTGSIKVAGTYDLTIEQVKDAADIVLRRLESLLAGRVGDPLTDAESKQAMREAARRRDERIPPGYLDEKKSSPEQAAGDYLVWRQLMNEAKLHEVPVLLVTNEQKEDWVLKGSSNQILGPRPELVLEMKKEANCALHMVTVVGLLKEAPEFLGTAVSLSTILEAESLPGAQEVNVIFEPRMFKAFKELRPEDRDKLIGAFDDIKDKLRQGAELNDWPENNIYIWPDDVYSLRWSDSGMAFFSLSKPTPGGTLIVIERIVTDMPASYFPDVAGRQSSEISG